MHMDYVMSPSRGVFSVAYLNNIDREQSIERAARNGAAGAADGSGGKIVETRDVALAGAASKVYVIEAVRNGLTLQVHVVFVLTPDRIYHIGWSGLKDNVSEAEIAKFMTSFRSE